MRRALTRFFKPANYFAARAALIQAEWQDRGGHRCPSPARPPKGAIEVRGRRRGATPAQVGVANFCDEFRILPLFGSDWLV